MEKQNYANYFFSCCCRIVSKLTTSSPSMITGMVGHMPEYGSFARSPISTYY